MTSTGDQLGVAGREGEGPGEFRLPKAYPGPSGVWIFDYFNQRITPVGIGQRLQPSFRFLGAGIQQMLPMDGGRMVATGQLPASGSMNMAIHVLDDTGAVLHSQNPYEDHPRFSGLGGIRIAANRGASRFYTAFSTEYRILEWTSSGEPSRELHRDVDWFPANPDPVRDLQARPNAAIGDVYLRNSRELWVVIGVAEERDYPASATPRPTVESPAPSARAINRSHDTVVEVIDLAKNEVVARGRYDRYLQPLHCCDLFYAWHESDEGYLFLDLIRIRR
jgi:hypothetical protein